MSSVEETGIKWPKRKSILHCIWQCNCSPTANQSERPRQLTRQLRQITSFLWIKEHRMHLFSLFYSYSCSPHAHNKCDPWPSYTFIFFFFFSFFFFFIFLLFIYYGCTSSTIEPQTHSSEMIFPLHSRNNKKAGQKNRITNWRRSYKCFTSPLLSFFLFFYSFFLLLHASWVEYSAHTLRSYEIAIYYSSSSYVYINHSNIRATANIHYLTSFPVAINR